MLPRDCLKCLKHLSLTSELGIRKLMEYQDISLVVGRPRWQGDFIVCLWLYSYPTSNGFLSICQNEILRLRPGEQALDNHHHNLHSHQHCQQNHHQNEILRLRPWQQTRGDYRRHQCSWLWPRRAGPQVGGHQHHRHYHHQHHHQRNT